ncbi:MAG: hypothetical protein ABIQ97_01145 [Lysobacteraceae bacterium]
MSHPSELHPVKRLAGARHDRRRHQAELLGFALFALCICTGATAGPLAMPVANKPVCDRIDNSSPAIASKPGKPVARASAVASSTVVATSTDNDTPVSRSHSGGATIGRAHDGPRWQSFLPGMYK